ncbi:MAG: hypothetical protein ABI851_16670, partial [Saprospiraceae bacterium]
ALLYTRERSCFPPNSCTYFDETQDVLAQKMHAIIRSMKGIEILFVLFRIEVTLKVLEITGL